MTSGERMRLTREQVRLIDKLALERYHIPGLVLMENASRAVADAIISMASVADASVAIVCGGGNNGGDGFAVARHLHNRGAHVDLVLAAAPARLRGDALMNWQIVEAMGIENVDFHDSEDVVNAHAVDIVVDALFGTGLSRQPDADMTKLIEVMNRSGLPIVAIDLPSGLDCDSGEALGACIRATRTVTFVAEKVGFANPASKQYTGEITVGDIGCPRELIEEVAKMSPR
jgi:NAD(P)H-hydrate epimerase